MCVCVCLAGAWQELSQRRSQDADMPQRLQAISQLGTESILTDRQSQLMRMVARALIPVAGEEFPLIAQKQCETAQVGIAYLLERGCVFKGDPGAMGSNIGSSNLQLQLMMQVRIKTCSG